MPTSFSKDRVAAILLGLALCIVLFHCKNTNLTPVTNVVNNYITYRSYPQHINSTSLWTSGWQPVGHSYDEQVRLRDMSTVVAAWPETAEDNIPTVPCLSADGHLLVLSVAASRVRYGVSLTFVMVYPTDVKAVLPKNISSKPLSSRQLSLWCIFDDGSVTPVYSYDSKYGNDRASLLDCSLSKFAVDQLWGHNQTIRVYLASTTDKDRNIPILKAFVHAPTLPVNSPNSSQELLTLCTSPLHNKAHYLTQWIEFHRLVVFRKLVIYNTTDTNGDLSSVITTYTQKYPDLVDVVQWNFSTLGLVDVHSTRYFQTEALHDCLIRYGDQSDWLGMLDVDEYVVPLPPYETVVDYIHDNFGRRVIGSINIYSLFFCTKDSGKYTSEESDTTRLTIDRFTFRSRQRYKSGREKYLYRPRFIQYLSIHHQIIGLAKEQSSENHIALAHYTSLDHLRTMPGCRSKEYVKDTSIRERFTNRVKNAITNLATKL